MYIYEYELLCCKPKTNKTLQKKKKCKYSTNLECDSSSHSESPKLNTGSCL